MAKRTKQQVKQANAAPSAKERALSRRLQQLEVQARSKIPKGFQANDWGKMLLRGGNMLGSAFGFPKIFGSGAYKMNQNSCFDVGNQVPVVHSQSEKIIFRHREYLGDVSMNGPTFTTALYPIQPGLASSFPYLSQVASNFQEYSFRGLVYEFKTTSATALASGTNSALGSVMMAVQYRADATPFTSKEGILNEMWAVDTVPSSSIVLPVECSPKENPVNELFVRTQPLSSGDVKFFDLGTLTVATSGGQAGQTNVVGELWCSYEVEFFKPQIDSNTSGYASYTSVAYTNGAPWLASTILYNSISLVTTGTTLTIPGLRAGDKVFFSHFWAGASVSVVNPVITYTNGASSYLNATPNGTNTSLAINEIVRVTADGTLTAALTTPGVLPTGIGYNGRICFIPRDAST